MSSSAAALSGSYDYLLVALSIVIAILASYVALDFAGRVTAARGSTRAVRIAGGAVSMGVGIWSMHYVGMLAFQLLAKRTGEHFVVAFIDMDGLKPINVGPSSRRRGHRRDRRGAASLFPRLGHSRPNRIPSVEEMLAQADALMYVEKQRGRVGR